MLGYKKNIINKSKEKSLEMLEKLFIKHGLLEIECNGSLTVPNVISYFKSNCYAVTFYRNDPLVTLVAQVDQPYIYVESI